MTGRREFWPNLTVLPRDNCLTDTYFTKVDGRSCGLHWHVLPTPGWLHLSCYGHVIPLQTVYENRVCKPCQFSLIQLRRAVRAFRHNARITRAWNITDDRIESNLGLHLTNGPALSLGVRASPRDDMTRYVCSVAWSRWSFRDWMAAHSRAAYSERASDLRACVSACLLVSMCWHATTRPHTSL